MSGVSNGGDVSGTPSVPQALGRLLLYDLTGCVPLEDIRAAWASLESERGAADGGMTAGVSRYSSTEEVNPLRSDTCADCNGEIVWHPLHGDRCDDCRRPVL